MIVFFTCVLSSTFLLCLAQISSLFPNSNDDLLLEAIEPVKAVLQSSLSARCSIAIISDGSVRSTTIKQLLDIPGTELSTSSIEIIASGREIQAENSFEYLDNIHQIHKSSRCLMVMTASDEAAFLSSVVKYLYTNHHLIWPTRFLLVTRHHLLHLEAIKESLSFTNAILMACNKKLTDLRCDIVLRLPYSFRVVKIATWAQNNGLTIAPGFELFVDKFNRFVDAPNMVIAGDEYPPHMAVTVIPDAPAGKQPFVFSGPMVYILHMLANSMNFTYTLKRSIDGSWGYRRPNGSWTGMVGMLYRKEIDFALGPFGVTYSRSQAVDYSKPLLFDYARIAARQGDTEIDIWGFFLPLTSNVWASVFASLLISALALVVLSQFSKTSIRFLYSDRILDYFRILLQQDLLLLHRSNWEKILIGSWMITILVLLKSYSGNLMSLLAVRYIPQPYQTLQAVIDSRVSMIWEANTAYVQHFLSADTGVFKSVAEAGDQGLLKYVVSMKYFTYLDSYVMQGDHVFIVEDLSLKMLLARHFSLKGSCKFYLSSEMFLPLSFAMTVQKKSPLRQAIDKRIRAITESGLYNHWLENAIPNSTSCAHVPTKTTVQSSLSITNIWGMFMILFGGIVISLIILVLEIFHWEFFLK